MKKKYFTPEMEEMEVDSLDLLVGSCTDEKPKEGDDACPGEEVDDM